MGATHDVHTRTSSIFAAPASKVWRLVKKSSTLVCIARWMLGFSGSSRFPVEIRAGVLTPLVWLFAQVFFRYRQMRWRSLLKFP